MPHNDERNKKGKVIDLEKDEEKDEENNSKKIKSEKRKMNGEKTTKGEQSALESDKFSRHSKLKRTINSKGLTQAWKKPPPMMPKISVPGR